MAESIVADTPLAKPETAPEAKPCAQKMDAREYLEFLDQLERVGWRLANNTRAYLVLLDPTGHRVVQPVPYNSTVIDLDKELASHLMQAELVSTAALMEVRDVCTQRLKRRGIKDRPSIDSERLNIAMRALHELEVLPKAIKHAMDSLDNYEADILVQGLLLRIKTLTDVAHSALGDEGTDLEDLTAMVEGDL